MIKRTFVLDEASASYLDRAAVRLDVSKSEVVRAALRLYGEQLGRMTDEERDEALETFDELVPAIPTRSREEVEAELEAVRRARRGSGRRSGPRSV